MTTMCENTKCKFNKRHLVYGNLCFTDKTLLIGDDGKCTNYVKDTPENIKRVRNNKHKV